MHSLYVTKGPLATYKLFVRVYGGEFDGDLNNKHPNTVGLMKFCTLYSIMLASFMGRGHCLVMDSAYMGDAMALLGRFIWMINMIGTVQSNFHSPEVVVVGVKRKRWGADGKREQYQAPVNVPL